MLEKSFLRKPLHRVNHCGPPVGKRDSKIPSDGSIAEFRDLQAKRGEGLKEFVMMSIQQAVLESPYRTFQKQKSRKSGEKERTHWIQMTGSLHVRKFLFHHFANVCKGH